MADAAGEGRGKSPSTGDTPSPSQQAIPARRPAATPRTGPVCRTTWRIKRSVGDPYERQFWPAGKWQGIEERWKRSVGEGWGRAGGVVSTLFAMARAKAGHVEHYLSGRSAIGSEHRKIDHFLAGTSWHLIHPGELHGHHWRSRDAGVGRAQDGGLSSADGPDAGPIGGGVHARTA